LLGRRARRAAGERPRSIKGDPTVYKADLAEALAGPALGAAVS